MDMNYFNEKVVSFYRKIRLNPDPDIFTLVVFISIISLSLSFYNNYKIRGGLTLAKETVTGQKVLPVKDMIKKIKTGSPQLGNANAKVTMVVFEDFQCPFCKKFHDETFPLIKKEYIDTGKIKIIHQDLAFLGVESNAAHEAGQCANEQGKFWEFLDQIYENQSPGHNSGNFSDENLKKIAKKVGLDLVKFNECYDSQRYKNLVSEARSFANSYGISSTPSFVINGQHISGAKSFETFKLLIDNALK